MAVSANFPRPFECLFKPKRYKIFYGGRGAGRSWACARALLIIGMERSIRVLCARELQKSISESVHLLLSDQIAELGLQDFYEIQAARIIGANGTTFSFEGIKNNVNKIKSYEGVDYCWVEEAIKVSRNSWVVLIPTIRKEGSEIWITFNPELETDYTYIRFVKEATDEMEVVKTTWKDNPWFPETLRIEKDAEKKRDYDTYLNVWEGHCLQALEGAVYARELRRTIEEGRICSVSYNPEFPVDTFWDLGRANKTAIWFAQVVAMQYRVIDYYEANQSTIPMDDPTGGVNHFIKECQQRGYNYGTMWLPHDAWPKRLGMGRSIQEMIGKFYKVRRVPNLSREDGINAARLIFPNCWFDQENCSDGIQALQRYRYKVIEKAYNGNVVLSNEPVHDDASDAADAFRYMGIALKEPRDRPDVLGRLERLSAALLQKKKDWYGEGGRNSLGGRQGWMR